jgi:hypothetical protein
MALNLADSPSFKGELEARNVLKHKSYFTDNTFCFLRKHSRRNLYRDKRFVYFKNHPEHTNKICGQNAEFIVSSLTAITRNIKLYSVTDDIRIIDSVCLPIV